MILLRKSLNLAFLLCMTAGLVSCSGSDGHLHLFTHPRGDLTMGEHKVEQQQSVRISTSSEVNTASKSEVKREASLAPASPIVKQEASSIFPKKEDFSEPGTLKPTIYYFPVFNEDVNGCEASLKKPLFGSGRVRLIDVCPKSKDACALQGTCAIIQQGVLRAFNILDVEDGVEYYFSIDQEVCKYGYGVNSLCLDPFFTLAADLAIYKPGEVIFIPAVVGALLPDGSKHSGYFIIRDAGRGVKGRGRFDFFTGFYHWRSKENPFHKLGLGDIKTQIPYYRVQGETAKEFRSRRSYPLFPKK